MLETLIDNLNNIYDELEAKVIPDNIRTNVKVFGVEGTLANCKTFSTVEEMESLEAPEEDMYAIVYGTTYVGTYRYDNGSWTQIGDSSEEQMIMDVLNEVYNTSDQYEGNGGTDEEISQVLDSILEGGE